ncbi:hypothetical protein DFH06DRAFT_1124019 [Mycena polygramma]|nr:hypothetical protein DFH06DRAFT_1124019 [Mycena polygramma]
MKLKVPTRSIAFATGASKPLQGTHRGLPLVELGLRSLFSDGISPGAPIAPATRLHAIHPGNVDTEGPADDDPHGLGSCSGPEYLLNPAFTNRGKSNLCGEVSVKWRGCLWGCLDFLDMETRVEVAEMDVAFPLHPQLSKHKSKISCDSVTETDKYMQLEADKIVLVGINFDGKKGLELELVFFVRPLRSAHWLRYILWHWSRSISLRRRSGTFQYPVSVQATGEQRNTVRIPVQGIRSLVVPMDNRELAPVSYYQPHRTFKVGWSSTKTDVSMLVNSGVVLHHPDLVVKSVVPRIVPRREAVGINTWPARKNSTGKGNAEKRAVQARCLKQPHILVASIERRDQCKQNRRAGEKDLTTACAETSQVIVEVQEPDGNSRWTPD